MKVVAERRRFGVAVVSPFLLACGLIAGWCRADAPDPGTVFPQPAYTAEQFVDFIGINAAPFEKYITNKAGKGSGTKYPPEVFYDLGVRHYRIALKTARTRDDAPQLIKTAFEQHGVRPTMLLNLQAGTPEQLIETLKQYGGAEVIGAIEGPNEVNNKFPPQELNLKYGNKRDEAAGSLYMQEFYKALKADPVTKDITVIAFTAIFSDYRLAKPCDAFDFNNMHSYQGYREPSSSLLKNFIRANNMLPVGGVIKPFMPTECGYNIEEDKTNQIKGNGSPKSQAINLPMLLGEYFRHGFVERTYLFALHNADGYGLLESDQETKRPAYHALKSLIDALQDAKWNPATRKWEGGEFAPRALVYTVEGAPDTFKAITLQKQSGEYSLLMWNELPNWDSAAKREIEHAPAKITLNFKTPVRGVAQVLRQDDSGAYKPAEELKIENGAMSVSVPSALIIVRVMPVEIAPSAPVPAPAQLSAETTENVVQLKWQPADGAAGYFVYRNNWCIGSLGREQLTFEDRSPWIRPGLGYTYHVQAYDAAGSLSPRAMLVAQTLAKFPDLVVTEFGPEKAPTTGQSVRFRAKVKNIGDGATPIDVPISVSFRVDGKVVAWFSEDGILKPGEEREYFTDGGPGTGGAWTATDGAHTLAAVLDDINRIPGEKSKNNNLADRSMVVGAVGAGSLNGSSAASPRRVDLSAEGTEDWVHWGFEGVDKVNRKAGAAQIGAVTPVGKAKFGMTGGSAIRCSWSNGDPTGAVENTNAALWTNGVGNGYAITVPADQEERVLRVYASAINGGACSLTATLSDGSAAPYVSTIWTGNSGRGSSAPVAGDFAAVYTIRYRAASAKQTLTVELKLDAEASRNQAQVRLSAATLRREAAK